MELVSRLFAIESFNNILLYTHVQVGLTGPELGNEAFCGVLDRL